MSSTPLPPPPTTRIDEEEPLLGGDRRVTNLQAEDEPLWHNLFSGTALIAQAGGVILGLTVFVSVFTHKLILFSAHPLLNTLGIAVLLQSALILQPTRTAAQKRLGTLVHATLNAIALTLMYAALAVIVANKLNHNGKHFESPHAILGLITYIALTINATIGHVQYFFPNLVGGVDNGKALYKYHRIIGYTGVVLILSTLVAATRTPYVKNVLHIKTWAVVLSGILVLAGALPRVRLEKFGFQNASRPIFQN